MSVWESSGTKLLTLVLILVLTQDPSIMHHILVLTLTLISLGHRKGPDTIFHWLPLTLLLFLLRKYEVECRIERKPGSLYNRELMGFTCSPILLLLLIVMQSNVNEFTYPRYITGSDAVTSVGEMMFDSPEGRDGSVCIASDRRKSLGIHGATVTVFSTN
jgi:hypothetical protein